MKNPSESDHPAQRLDARASILLVINVNSTGEISPALERAFRLAGPHAKTVSLPAEILHAEKIEGTGLLIRGRQVSVIWCSSGNLEAIGRIAAKFSARFAANWEGFADLHAPVKTTKETQGRLSLPGFSQHLGLLLFVLSLALVPGLPGAQRTTPPLVENSTVCGPDLLARIGTAAETAGFVVEKSEVRSRMESEPGIDLILPAVIISPPLSGVAKPMTLPFYAPLHSGQRVTLSFHLLAQDIAKVNAPTVHLVINRRGVGVVAEKTTTISRTGWTVAAVSWQSDAEVSASDLSFEIRVASTAPIKVAFPLAFVTGR